MEDYSRQRHEEAGYEFVYTPHITKGQLFETSGHLDWYADGMFPPMQLDEGTDYYLKPMNCPMHNLIFDARGRSYRELPLRLFEFGTVYRYEKSGVVHGLTRVRGFTQDDAHIYCTRSRWRTSSTRCSPSCSTCCATTAWTTSTWSCPPRTRRSSSAPTRTGRRPPRRCARSPRSRAWSWSRTRAAPRSTARRSPSRPRTRSAAPGRCRPSSSTSTCRERFELEYQAPDGTRQRPVMIHRALFGSIERFFGVLLEHYAGAFPAWLAPVQVVGIPIGDAHVDVPAGVRRAGCRRRGIRVEVDASADRMQKKIRNAQKQKVPFMLIAGDDDMADGAVSFRYRDGSQENGVPVDEAIAEIVEGRRGARPGLIRPAATAPGGPREPQRSRGPVSSSSRANTWSSQEENDPVTAPSSASPHGHQHDRDQSGRAGSPG